MSKLDFHVLLALAAGPLYGYAITDAIAVESSGTLMPRAASLYRVVARLITTGWVTEAEAPAESEPHPGLPRRYYELTAPGRQALAAEARRLQQSAAAATRRLGVAQGRS